MPGGLRQRLDDHDAGHQRPVGKVPGKVRLIVGNVLQRADALAGHVLEHAVHQQERIAMRQAQHDAR